MFYVVALNLTRTCYHDRSRSVNFIMHFDNLVCAQHKYLSSICFSFSHHYLVVYLYDICTVGCNLALYFTVAYLLDVLLEFSGIKL